jgi:hypothetical protein
MEAKYIITLREPINTGSGVTKLIEAKSWYGLDCAEPNVVRFELEDGTKGVLPIKNIAGIHPKKETK